MNSPHSMLRCGVVAVVVRQSKLLVIRRSLLVAAPGAWCFPGGAVEPGESESEALIRELREELAVEIQPVEPIWRCVTSRQVDLSWWRAVLDDGAEPVPNPDEVESAHWLSPQELLARDGLLDSNRAFLQEMEARGVALQQW